MRPREDQRLHFEMEYNPLGCQGYPSVLLIAMINRLRVSVYPRSVLSGPEVDFGLSVRPVVRPTYSRERREGVNHGEPSSQADLSGMLRRRYPRFLVQPLSHHSDSSKRARGLRPDPAFNLHHCRGSIGRRFYFHWRARSPFPFSSSFRFIVLMWLAANPLMERSWQSLRCVGLLSDLAASIALIISPPLRPSEGLLKLDVRAVGDSFGK